MCRVPASRPAIDSTCLIHGGFAGSRDSTWIPPMHEALILIALAHDHWRRTIGRRLPRSGRIDVFEERLWRASANHGSPTWLVSDKDHALRNKLVNALLTRLGIRRRYGAVGKEGSICLIERFR